MQNNLFIYKLIPV